MAKCLKQAFCLAAILIVIVLFEPVSGRASVPNTSESEKSMTQTSITETAVTVQEKLKDPKVAASVEATETAAQGLFLKEGSRAMPVQMVFKSDSVQYAQETLTTGEEIPTIRTTEKVKGEVTELRSDEIGVLYNRTETAEYEKRIPLSPNTKFYNFSKLNNLSLNDMVEITYEKMIQYPKQGPGEKRFMTAKSVTLLKKYTPEQDAQEQTA